MPTQLMFATERTLRMDTCEVEFKLVRTWRNNFSNAENVTKLCMLLAVVNAETVDNVFVIEIQLYISL